MTEPGSELMTDYWKQIPNGQEKPKYFDTELKWKGRTEWPEELEKQIEQRHGQWQSGYTWECANLPNTEYSVVMIRRTPDDNTNIDVVWKNDIVKMAPIDGDIYFYDKHAKNLQSVKDLRSEISRHPVQLWIYGQEEAKRSPGFNRLRDRKGQVQAYSVVIQSLMKLENILLLVHELGHVVVDSKSPDKYKQEREVIDPPHERDLEAAKKKIEDLGGNKITDEERAKIKREFYQSEGFQGAVNLEMIEEFDAWGEAKDLLRKIGIIEAFDKGDDQLLNFMLFNIKTRIPKDV